MRNPGPRCTCGHVWRRHELYGCRVKGCRCPSFTPAAGPTEGARLKEEGLDRIEATNQDFVARMRALAVDISADRGAVHVDDLRVEADRRGWQPRHKNAWGAIFRGPAWKKIGERASRYRSNHAHVSPIWRYEI